MNCCFPSKKLWTKNTKPQEINIKPKPIKNTIVVPLFEGNSPKHEPGDKRMHVSVSSIILKDDSCNQKLSNTKK